MTGVTGANDPSRFSGGGVGFKAKLIGIDDVDDPRGDKMCQDTMIKLKASVKIAGEHKQRVLVNVSLDGIKLLDERSGALLHQHAVHKISFISRDTTDPRAFGYIYGAGDGKHRYFAIKTEKPAEGLVITLRDLFQHVFELKKKEIEAKKNKTDEESTTTETNGTDNVVGHTADQAPPTTEVPPTEAPLTEKAAPAEAAPPPSSEEPVIDFKNPPITPDEAEKESALDDLLGLENNSIANLQEGIKQMYAFSQAPSGPQQSRPWGAPQMPAMGQQVPGMGGPPVPARSNMAPPTSMPGLAQPGTQQTSWMTFDSPSPPQPLPQPAASVPPPAAAGFSANPFGDSGAFGAPPAGVSAASNNGFVQSPLEPAQVNPQANDVAQGKPADPFSALVDVMGGGEVKSNKDPYVQATKADFSPPASKPSLLELSQQKPAEPSQQTGMDMFGGDPFGAPVSPCHVPVLGKPHHPLDPFDTSSVFLPTQVGPFDQIKLQPKTGTSLKPGSGSQAPVRPARDSPRALEAMNEDAAPPAPPPRTDVAALRLPQPPASATSTRRANKPMHTAALDVSTLPKPTSGISPHQSPHQSPKNSPSVSRSRLPRQLTVDLSTAPPPRQGMRDLMRQKTLDSSHFDNPPTPPPRPFTSAKHESKLAQPENRESPAPCHTDNTSADMASSPNVFLDSQLSSQPFASATLPHRRESKSSLESGRSDHSDKLSRKSSGSDPFAAVTLPHPRSDRAKSKSGHSKQQYRIQENISPKTSISPVPRPRPVQRSNTPKSVQTSPYSVNIPDSPRGNESSYSSPLSRQERSSSPGNFSVNSHGSFSVDFNNDALTSTRLDGSSPKFDSLSVNSSEFSADVVKGGHDCERVSVGSAEHVSVTSAERVSLTSAERVSISSAERVSSTSANTCNDPFVFVDPFALESKNDCLKDPFGLDSPSDPFAKDFSKECNVAFRTRAVTVGGSDTMNEINFPSIELGFDDTVFSKMSSDSNISAFHWSDNSSCSSVKITHTTASRDGNLIEGCVGEENSSGCASYLPSDHHSDVNGEACSNHTDGQSTASHNLTLQNQQEKLGTSSTSATTDGITGKLSGCSAWEIFSPSSSFTERLCDAAGGGREAVGGEAFPPAALFGSSVVSDMAGTAPGSVSENQTCSQPTAQSSSSDPFANPFA